ncbi:MAG: RDD family protein [Nocardioides sp.]
MSTPELEPASWPRRMLALLVDWIACTLVVVSVIGTDAWLDDRYSSTYTLGVFLLETTVFTALLGGSFGKLVTRLRVVQVDGSGRPVDLLRCLVRQVLVCLVVPPLVFRPDGRGLHDLAAGSATVLWRTR